MQVVPILAPVTYDLSPEADPWLTSLDGPIFTIVVAGRARIGKSDLAGRLAHQLRSSESAAAAPVFPSSASWQACTSGAHAVAIRRESGGHWLIIDTEGTDAGASLPSSKFLSLLGHRAGLLLLLEYGPSCQTITTLGRLLVGAVTLGADPLSWPDLHLVVSGAVTAATDADVQALLGRALSGPDCDEARVIAAAYPDLSVSNLPRRTEAAYERGLQALVERVRRADGRAAAPNGAAWLAGLRADLAAWPPTDSGSAYERIARLLCQQSADRLRAEAVTALPRDGRTDDDVVRQRHQQLAASVLERHRADGVRRGLPDAVVDSVGADLRHALDLSLEGVLSDNAAARALVSSIEETLTTTSGEQRTYANGVFTCVVQTTVRRRVRQQQANGDVRHTPWTQTTTSSTFARPDTIGVGIGTQIACAPDQTATLDEAQSLDNRSTAAAYQLRLQLDGNLVLYENGSRAVWNSETHGRGLGPYRLVVSGGDGRLVLYGHETPLWSRGPFGPGAYVLVLQADRNLVLYKNGDPVWASDTWIYT